MQHEYASMFPTNITNSVKFVEKVEVHSCTLFQCYIYGMTIPTLECCFSPMTM